MDRSSAESLVADAAERCWEDSLAAMEATAFRDPYRFTDFKQMFSVMFSLFRERRLKYMGDLWSEDMASSLAPHLLGEAVVDLRDGETRTLSDYSLQGVDFPNSSYIENLVCNRMAYTAYEFYASFDVRRETFCKRLGTDNSVPLYIFRVRSSECKSWLYDGLDMKRAFDVAALDLWTNVVENKIPNAKTDLVAFPYVASTMDGEDIGRCVSPLWWS